MPASSLPQRVETPRSIASIEPLERRLMLATISGTVFHDMDGDGVLDSGDAGLDFWRVYIDSNNNGAFDSSEPSDITSRGGVYAFTVGNVGTFVIRQELKRDWLQTSPTGGSYTVFIFNGNNSTGRNFGNAQPASISGFKFMDDDGNGSWFGGADVPGFPTLLPEPKLSGWTIYLDANSNGALDSGERSTLTDASGNFEFPRLVPGRTYVVREMMQSGWEQYAPEAGSHTLSLTSGQSLSEVAFGNAQPASIAGVAYHDLDGDGVGGDGEPGLADRVVYIDANHNGARDPGERYTLTDSDGNFLLDDVPLTGTKQFDAFHMLRQEVPAGWIQTWAGMHAYTWVQLGSGDQAVRRFPSAQPGSIGGQVFEDLDGDALRDAGEPALADSRVFLDTDGNGVFDTGEAITTADSAGNYTFAGLRPARYVVSHLVPTGYVQTSPSLRLHEVHLLSGENLSPHFGDTRTGSLSGRVVHDLNGDGLFQPDEPGLGDWTTFVDVNGNGSPDELSSFTSRSLEPLGEADPAPGPLFPTSIATVAGIAGQRGVVSNIAVKLSAHSVDIGQTRIELISPSGTLVVLMARNEATGEDLHETTFSDSAPVSLAAGTSPYTGAFRPAFPLSQFRGEDPNGFWRLRLTNWNTSGLTYLDNWSLTLNLTEPTTLSDTTGAFNFNDVLPGSMLLRQLDLDGWAQTFPATGVHAVSLAPGQSLTPLDFGNRDTVAPSATEALFKFESKHSIALRFTEDVSASLAAADLLLHNLTTGQVISSDAIAATYDAVTDTAMFTFPGMSKGILPDGNYLASVSAGDLSDAAGNALAGDVALDFFVLAGDADRDRDVDFFDFLKLRSNYGQTGKLFSDGDFDYDGDVDFFDFLILRGNYGATLPPPSGSGSLLDDGDGSGGL